MMIRCPDDDRVNLRIHLLQHDTVVFEPFGLRKPIEHAGRAILIDITQRDDILRRHLLNITCGTTARSNRSDVQFLVGCIGTSGTGFQNCQGCRRRSCGLKEATSIQGVVQHPISLFTGA